MTNEKKLRYVGPTLDDCWHPWTWGTSAFPPEKGGGRPKFILRKHFKEQIIYVEQAQLFVTGQNPDFMETDKELDRRMASLSDVADISKYVLREQPYRVTKLAYEPGTTKRLITVDGTSAFNTYRPPNIKPKSGDVGPFLEFTEYLFPVAQDRHEALRWAATLIARPKIRMLYTLLLISKMQGTGKSTFANILAKLIGKHNVSYPSDTDIEGKYKGWIANKRLAIVEEIYQGHSFKTANRLKSVISDETIRVEEKYQTAYELDSKIHVLATPNSERPLKLTKTDRRWFAPAVTETRWPPEKFRYLHSWLDGDGLAHIAHWATKFTDYVKEGEHAPTTDVKTRIMRDSESEAEQHIRAIAEAAMESDKPLAFTKSDATDEALRQTNSKVWEGEEQISAMLVDAGLSKVGRVRIDKAKQLIFCNPAAQNQIEQINDTKQRNDMLRGFRTNWMEMNFM